MLGDVLAGELPEFRRQAESRMTETVQFYTVSAVDDPVTFVSTLVELPVGEPTRARLRSDGRSSRELAVVGQVAALNSLVLSVPVGSVLVGADVFARVLDSSSDSGLVGVVVRTLFEPTLGQVSAWRYPVEAVSRD